MDRRDGSGLLTALLSALLLLVAVVAWQAVDAASSHRAAAESVLRDYAELAAAELARRAAADIGYYGVYPVLRGLRLREAGRLPSAAELAAGLDEGSRRGLPLVRYLFRWSPEDGWEAAGEPPADAVATGLVEVLRSVSPRASDPAPAISAAHVEVDGRTHRAVFGVLEGGGVVGFGLHTAELAPWLREAVGGGPLLPASLADGEITNDVLALRVTEEDGSEIFTAGDPRLFQRDDPYQPPIHARVPFGQSYEGLLDGMTVAAAIDPRAAPRLVIGGLPRSRLPVLGGLLGLAAALMGVAGFQLRRARSLARLRSDFVSQVSHELRTPLTQIRMFAETLLLERVRSPSESRRALEIVDQEARRLGQLVENVLQFSRGERGSVRISPRLTDLAPIVRAAIEDFRPLAATADLELRVDEGGLQAPVDADALRQILLNLLDNAVKYGPPEQRVSIALRRCGPAVQLRVEDQGPGVPRPQRERIWRSFRRLERDRRKAVAGTGIGLAVVRELVSLHEGRCWVEEGPGGGACFVVELPAERPGEPPPVTPEAGRWPGRRERPSEGPA